MELHASTCPRCQSMLAAFARGVVPASVPDPSVQTESVRWWRWWLAPIAAGAAAVTLWMVVPEQQQIATAPPKPEASGTVDQTQSQGKAAATDQPPAATPQTFAD